MLRTLPARKSSYNRLAQFWDVGAIVLELGRPRAMGENPLVNREEDVWETCFGKWRESPASRGGRLITDLPEGLATTPNHQRICCIRFKMIALYRFMRSGRRFSGPGRTAASRAASCRPMFRAGLP